MGFLGKLKEKGRGIVTVAKPQEGAAVLSLEEVRTRLLAIDGKGIDAREEDDSVIVTWSAKIKSSGFGGSGFEYRYRAIHIELNESDHQAAGICVSKTSGARLGGGSFSGGKDFQRGQPVGSEKVVVLAWLGPHQTEGAADESGYSFSWSDLRDPVIEAVTGAGWTYKPKKI